MSAATVNRNTKEEASTQTLSKPVAASTTILNGVIGCVNTSGYAVEGSASATLITIGRTEEYVDNSAGAAGAKNVKIRQGRFWWVNSDGIAASDVKKPCYVVDNQTVAKSSSSGARPPAGIILAVDSTLGVLVEMSVAISGALARDSAGTSYTQTYSTANRTVANPTATAPAAATFAAPTTLTDNTGLSGGHDDTLAATAAPTTLTDNTSYSGTHDDTLAAVTPGTALLVGTLGGAADGTMESVGATNGGDVSGAIMNNFQELFARVNTANAQLAVVAQNQSDIAQKVIELVTLVGVMAQNISDVGQKVIEHNTQLAALAADRAADVTQITALVADDLDNRQTLTAVIDDLQTVGIVG